MAQAQKGYVDMELDYKDFSLAFPNVKTQREFFAQIIKRYTGITTIYGSEEKTGWYEVGGLLSDIRKLWLSKDCFQD